MEESFVYMLPPRKSAERGCLIGSDPRQAPLAELTASDFALFSFEGLSCSKQDDGVLLSAQ